MLGLPGMKQTTPKIKLIKYVHTDLINEFRILVIHGAIF